MNRNSKTEKLNHIVRDYRRKEQNQQDIYCEHVYKNRDIYDFFILFSTLSGMNALKHSANIRAQR